MTALAEPHTISLLSLADRFIEDHNRMPNRAFAFVLGAGASRSSGIKGASQMAEDWIRSLHREATGEIDGDCKAWATAKALGVEGYNPVDPAASYSELYRKMYARDPDRGYAYLEEQMRDAEPSYGYSVLARIMESTQHKVVVTTNFDNLVADALSIFGKTYPLVCGHESLAGFISPRVRRPLVVKVHRDLLLAPKSAPEDLGDLPDSFRAALMQLFGHYTPIVIGYGGNDGSLMGFLKTLPPRSVPGGVYWCYWKGGAIPPDEIRQFVAAQNGYLVPIPGFDETMMLLSEAIGYEVPDQFLRERAEQRAKRIGEQVLALKEKLASDQRRSPKNLLETDHRNESTFMPPTSGPDQDKDTALVDGEADALIEALKSTMRRTSGATRWWQWQDRAEAAANDDERDRIYQEAINALPDSHELLNNYASFLSQSRKDYDKAESYYARALSVDPGRPRHLGNYAIFMSQVRKDYDKAEEYYIRAISADPEYANNLANYGSFLSEVRKEQDKAEEYYLRALSADPEHANSLHAYARYLTEIRKEYDKAEELYVRALSIAPDASDFHNSYAIFLTDVRKDYAKAEEHYVRALEINPTDANALGNYTRLLLAGGKIEQGLDMLERAMAVPEADVPPELAVELRMYAFCHRLPDEWRNSLQELKKKLVVDKTRTGDWDFSSVIASANTRGHPAAEWLEPLAAVCAGKADASTLNNWKEWSRA